MLAKANLKSNIRTYVASSIAIFICCIFIVASSSLVNMMQWATGAGATQQHYNTSVIVNKRIYDSATTEKRFAVKEIDKLAQEGKTIDEEVINKVSGGLYQHTTDEDSAEYYYKTEQKPLIDAAKVLLNAKDKLGENTAVAETHDLVLPIHAGKKEESVQVNKLLDQPFFQPGLESGSLPEKANEVLIYQDLADKYKLKAGDNLPIAIGGTADKKETVNFKITGVASEDFNYKVNGVLSKIYLPKAAFDKYSYITDFQLIDEILISSTDYPAVTADKVAKILQEANIPYAHRLGAIPVSAHAQEADTLTSANFVINQSLAGIFPLISLLVCISIVSTTFRVVLNRRKREFALLRCIGGSVKQLRRIALTECLVVGAVASILGTAVGWIGVFSFAYFFKLTTSPALIATAIGITPIMLSLICGILVAFLGGIRPVLGISKVRPIEALSNLSADVEKFQIRIVRFIFIFLFTVAALGLWWISYSHSKVNTAFNVSMTTLSFFTGSLCLFIALLLLAKVTLPAFTASIFKLFDKFFPTVHIARLNVSRNPSRTGATATALLLGITLVTSILIGSATLQKTADNVFDRLFPVDLTITPTGEEKFSEADAKRIIGKFNGFEYASTLKGYEIESIVNQKGEKLSLDYPQLTQAALDKEVQEAKDNPEKYVVHEAHAAKHYAQFIDADLEQKINHQIINRPKAGELWIMPIYTEEPLTKKDLEGTWKVHFTNGTVLELKPKLAPEQGNIFPKQVQNSSGYAISESDRDKLKNTGLKAQAVSYVANMYEPDIKSIFSGDFNIAEEASRAQIGGGFPYRISLTVMLTVLSLVLSILIGISAIVAMVGVANILLLAVAERKRENATLRTIGFNTKQIRRMLYLEGSFIGIGAVILGVAFSCLIAEVGLLVMPTFEGTIYASDKQLAIPWLIVGIISAVTILFCFLASIIPGRAAGKASPVEALNNSY